MPKKTKFSGRGGKNPRIGSNKTSSGKVAAFSQSKSSTNPDRDPGKQTHLRSKGTVRLLNQYKEKVPGGKLSRKQSLTPARVQPDRRWFGNTRMIDQETLTQFREGLEKIQNDPMQIVVKRSKLPMSLLHDPKERRMNLLEVEPFDEIIGKTKKRKVAKMADDVTSFETMASKASRRLENYVTDQDANLVENQELKMMEETPTSDGVMKKGTSKRIWAELWKVVDSADILLQVIDARDPLGTRCRTIESEIKNHRKHKHMIFILNKADLIPISVCKKWVELLSKEFPTVAFHASITNPQGKASLISLLRQYSILLKDRKHVSVGFVGYPNVGKSSVINALKSKKVCKSAPIPGETKVWQYIALTKRMYLIDCPGIVPIEENTEFSDVDKVLRGAVRPERISGPCYYVEFVLQRVKESDLRKKYGLDKSGKWRDAEEFLSILAEKYGRKKKGGELDLDLSARSVLYDWQRGRIPYFVSPPE